jgi:hypothetical protein
MKIAVVILAALTFAAAACADTWQVHFTSAGQAAAHAVVLKHGDLGTAGGWSGGSVKPDLNSTPPCASFRPKQSDLVVIGAAATAWKHAGVQLNAQANVLKTARMVTLDWQRTVLPPQVAPCLREGLVKQLGTQGRIVDFGRVSFPRLATYTRAYRAVVDVNGVRVDTDVIVLGKRSTEITLTLIAPSAARTVDEHAEATLVRRMVARVR